MREKTVPWSILGGFVKAKKFLGYLMKPEPMFQVVKLKTFVQLKVELENLAAWQVFAIFTCAQANVYWRKNQLEVVIFLLNVNTQSCSKTVFQQLPPNKTHYRLQPDEGVKLTVMNQRCLGLTEALRFNGFTKSSVLNLSFSENLQGERNSRCL